MREVVDWNNKNVSILRQYYNKIPAKDIAALIGHPCTKNSVISKAHSLGLSNKNTPKDTGRGIKNKIRNERLKNKKVKAKVLKDGNVNYEQLKDHHCRFIVNDDTRNPIYCGARRLTYSSYCLRHHNRCHGLDIEKVSRRLK